MSVTVASGSAVYEDSLPRFATGIADDELDILRGLLIKWRAKYPRNVLRTCYFDGKVRIKPTGNMPAESLAKIKAVLDWPEKAVTKLAERSVFEGFVSPGGTDDPFELDEILDENRFDLELPQAIESAYKHSCSFITTVNGDTAAGEPEVVVMARSAEWSVATWNSRLRRVDAGLAITSTDSEGRPDALDLYLPDKQLHGRRRPSGAWVFSQTPNPLGEPLIEPLTYAPQLDRPFGRSRISRAVMNITDRAILTIGRTEVSADFYAAPRMAALGVAEDAFSRGKWAAAIDSWFAVTKDEEGDVPTVSQFPQMTMQPLSDQYRMIATQFSGATGVPVSDLGIVTDNPPSAEALFADDRRIVATSKRQNRNLGASLRQVAKRIVRLRDTPYDADELRKISASWAKPEFTSPGAAADSLVKLAAVMPWIGESDVALEWAGFSQTEITRLLADKRRAAGGSTLDRLLGSSRDAVDAAPAGDSASLEEK